MASFPKHLIWWRYSVVFNQPAVAFSLNYRPNWSNETDDFDFVPQ